MGIVTTIPEKCKRCYTCVRECPAKAIKVESGQAMVMEERCIVCGNCVKVCAQKAKSIEHSVAYVEKMLQENQRVFACLAPSFPAAFYPTRPNKVISALRKIGFSKVWEVAFGAELISKEYDKLFKKSLDTGERVITTPCPAIVSYVLKYIPSLHNALAPIVSPMIAVARAIRHRYGSDVRIVFIGPCIAKKNEIRDPCVEGIVDAVLSYKELDQLFDEAGIEAESLQEGSFDSPPCNVGRSFPISGGLLKTAGLSTDILENNILITEGKDRVLTALRELAEGKCQVHFFDILFCEGCINGPKMRNDMSVFARKQIIADFVNEQSKHTTEEDVAAAQSEFKDLDLSRTFSSQVLILPQPTEEEISAALRAMRKFSPDDQLNCGACGYPTCREKAIAVCQGLAEPEMCLPYLVDELEVALGRLRQSHEDLVSAQQRLVQTERLASMGQISAGVAHEINNPLGTIILYSHILLKRLQDDSSNEDLKMIVGEATRCKNIVRGLLDFSRQSRISKAPTDLTQLIREVVTIMNQKVKLSGIRITSDLQHKLPTMMLDATQIKQMLINLVQNGIDAIDGSGDVNIKAQASEIDDTIEIRVTDNGCGIPEENLSRLFTPFFTTKEIAKGTGLGLAISYGIVKMHSGNISVKSEKGKGTTFFISLPIAEKQNEKKETGKSSKKR